LLFKTAFHSTTPPPLLERSLTESTQALPKNDNSLKLNIPPCQKAGRRPSTQKGKAKTSGKNPSIFRGIYVSQVGNICASTNLADLAASEEVPFTKCILKFRKCYTPGRFSRLEHVLMKVWLRSFFPFLSWVMAVGSSRYSSRV